MDPFLYLCKAQLFWDGNKRTAHIVANKVTIGDNTLALVIRKGIQFPDNNKYLFDRYNGIIEIHPDVDVSNIVVAECMFANTEKANPNTAKWELPSDCNTKDMFLNAKAYTGKQFE